MERRVWVLGAGFSRSLGGPLLTDLFSEGLEHEVKVKYKELLTDTRFTQAITFYRWGTERKLWRNAEDYLDRLESAVELGENSPVWEFLWNEFKWSEEERLEPLIERTDKGVFLPAEAGRAESLGDVLHSGKQWMAAECCAFLKGAGVKKSERWEPYRNWAESLGANRDIIITFNYDRVLEELIEVGVSNLDVVTSQEDIDSFNRRAFPCPILKLHGSVDWKQVEHKGFERLANCSHFSIAASETELAIATPGPAKSRFVQKLQPLWNFAEEALEKATRIFFVGYRFPETDAESRRRLLHAIYTDESLGYIDTVLGPDTSAPYELVKKSAGTRVSVGLPRAFGNRGLAAWPRQDHIEITGPPRSA